MTHDDRCGHRPRQSEERIVPIVSRIYPVQRIREALAYLGEGRHIGKVVISHTAEGMVDRTEQCIQRLVEQKQRAEAEQARSLSIVVNPDRDGGRGVDPLLEGIAIIGMSGQFPIAPTVADFWANVARGQDCTSEIPPSRWPLDHFYDPDPKAPGKTYSKWMGVLEDIDKFDPLFFSISPAEAELMDPSNACSWTTAGTALKTPASARVPVGHTVRRVRRLCAQRLRPVHRHGGYERPGPAGRGDLHIGHLLAAAGVSGLIKVLRALKHKMLSPTINFETLNEHINLEDSPLYINTELKPWAGTAPCRGVDLWLQWPRCPSRHRGVHARARAGRCPRGTQPSGAVAPLGPVGGAPRRLCGRDTGLHRGQARVGPGGYDIHVTGGS